MSKIEDRCVSTFVEVKKNEYRRTYITYLLTIKKDRCWHICEQEDNFKKKNIKINMEKYQDIKYH